MADNPLYSFPYTKEQLQILLDEGTLRKSLKAMYRVLLQKVHPDNLDAAKFGLGKAPLYLSLNTANELIENAGDSQLAEWVKDYGNGGGSLGGISEEGLNQALEGVELRVAQIEEEKAEIENQNQRLQEAVRLSLAGQRIDPSVLSRGADPKKVRELEARVANLTGALKKAEEKAVAFARQTTEYQTKAAEYERKARTQAKEYELCKSQLHEATERAVQATAEAGSYKLKLEESIRAAESLIANIVAKSARKEDTTTEISTKKDDECSSRLKEAIDAYKRTDYAAAIGLLGAKRGTNLNNAAQAALKIADIQYGINKYSLMLSWAEEALSKDQSARAYFAVGQFFYNAGVIDRAEVCFKQAYKLDPENAVAAFNLASIYADQGKTGLAKSWCGEALKARPNYPKVNELLSRL